MAYRAGEQLEDGAPAPEALAGAALCARFLHQFDALIRALNK